MEVLTLIVAIALAALLVAREVRWRRETGRLLDQLQAAGAAGAERDRLASMGQLVSGLAQELKRPLQGVLGNAELLIAMAPPGAEGTDDLREIQQNAAHAAGMVRNLLALAGPGTLTCRWQDLNEVARRAVVGCRRELDACGLRAQVQEAERLPLVYVDGRQLEKVIATLVSRPVPRSTPSRESAAIMVSARRETDDRLVIEIDDRTASQAFDESSWSGDLEACRRIMEAHGGALKIERHPARGFRFHLELPVTAGGPGSAAD